MTGNGHISSTARYDAIVIGAGPAGSTAAAVLAEKGRRVVILEKQKFPRYSVGESLIPYCYFPLERIGVLEKIKQAAFVKKYSVQFASVDGRVSQPFYFFQHLEHEASQTWQVWRGEFDKILLDNAVEKGARVLQETVAKKLIRDGDQCVGVEARGKDGASWSLHAPITIDCSGRDGFALKRNDWLVRDPKLNKISIWTYYRARTPRRGLRRGSDHGCLPARERLVLVSSPLGRRCGRGNHGGSRLPLPRRQRMCRPSLSERSRSTSGLKSTWRPPNESTTSASRGEYSYRSRYCAANGLVLAGYAFAFLDPVFSSGVLLALRGGEMAGDAVDEALTAGDFSAAEISCLLRATLRGHGSHAKARLRLLRPSLQFRQTVHKYPTCGPTRLTAL